jgi:orotate phosphoribosyltransferase
VASDRTTGQRAARGGALDLLRQKFQIVCPARVIVTLVEDVITTGGAVIGAARSLCELGPTVTTVVCAIGRSPSGASSLADERIAVKSVLTKALLDAAAITT